MSDKMTPEEYIKLYKKFVSGTCSATERKQLLDFKDEFKLINTSELEQITDREKEIGTRILQRIERSTKPIIPEWFKYAAAIVIVFLIGLLWENYYQQINNANEKIVTRPKEIQKIDSTQVMLSFANGSLLALDSVQNGQFTLKDSHGFIDKANQDEVVYRADNNWSNISETINKLYIPKGRQYNLTLADGTKVWLNANSTLSYPSNFIGSTRQVELSGEAYFEVARNENIPFIVTTARTKIQVLGTHFNVSAYADDTDDKTSLFEGAVKLLTTSNAVVINPGEQGITGIDGIEVKSFDINKVKAWREGYFLFKNDNLEDVMRQIARWYDVTVEYEIRPENKIIGGIYAKTKDLDELLKGLELTELVKFKVINPKNLNEKRKIIIIN